MEIYVVKHHLTQPGLCKTSLIVIEGNSDVNKIIKDNQNEFGVIERVYKLSNSSKNRVIHIR